MFLNSFFLCKYHFGCIFKHIFSTLFSLSVAHPAFHYKLFLWNLFLYATKRASVGRCLAATKNRFHKKRLSIAIGASYISYFKLRFDFLITGIQGIEGIQGIFWLRVFFRFFYIQKILYISPIRVPKSTLIDLKPLHLCAFASKKTNQFSNL